MDIIVFLIIIIVILFIYYLINVIKDLQLEVKNMSIKCVNGNDNGNGNGNGNDIKPIETIDIKMKNDIISFLDFLKNYFI
jgi:hypothetical protein